MKIKKIYIVLVIIIITTVATLPVYQKWESNNNSTSPPPITIIGPNTTGFTFLYQVDNIHGSNCFHFTMPSEHILSFLFVAFANVTSSGNCITVYNGTNCYIAKFQLQAREYVQAGEQFNISDFYPGNWSVSVNFASPTGNGNYHFLVYYNLLSA